MTCKADQQSRYVLTEKAELLLASLREEANGNGDTGRSGDSVYEVPTGDHDD